jgi:hypothetical protein
MEVALIIMEAEYITLSQAMQELMGVLEYSKFVTHLVTHPLQCLFLFSQLFLAIAFPK